MFLLLSNSVAHGESKKQNTERQEPSALAKVMMTDRAAKQPL